MATVKLLLKESIKNVGRVGDIVEVSPGYARNYLLPQDLAVEPTPNNVKKIEAQRKEIEKQERERREQQAALIKVLAAVEVTLERRANEQGHLFGGVSATDIAKSLQGQGYNVNPDDVSKKSLKVLDKKLQWLAEHAEFHVNINSVVGGGISNPQDALTIGKRAIELGFSSTVGIIHDGSGQVQPLNDEERRIYDEMKSWEKRSFTRINAFQDNIAQGLPNDWRCRAGARYLYICEDGLVHYCSQQRGYPGVPLATYTRDDLRREYLTEKSCAPHCTVSCVHQVSVFDSWRAPQHPAATISAAAGELVQIK